MASATKGELFGHPKGLYVLFFTELWERFSFYGMKALLILYMLKEFLYSQEHASMVMAWYAGLVYATPVLGGMIADKLLGARRTVLIGGIIIAIGHFLLAFPPKPFFYAGLIALIVGVGLLKPNISTQVGTLYRSTDNRRDSAFTIFYMGINMGAFLGPIICDQWLRMNYGFHYGFAAAGVGMVLGLVVYVLGKKAIVEGQISEEATPPSPATHAKPTTTSNHVLPERVVRDRVIVLIILCLFMTCFWLAFEQAANVMTVWAEDFTNRYVFQLEPPPVVIGVPAIPEAAGLGGEAAKASKSIWGLANGRRDVSVGQPVFHCHVGPVVRGFMDLA